MSELIVNGKNVIEPADFEQNKNEIQVLRDQVPSKIALGSFTENILFFDANVKAKDMNTVIIKVQEAFREVYQCNKNLFDEIGIIYKALGSLDEGYLKGIISAIQAAQEANNKAADAITAIKGTLKVLESFKNRLDKVKHLNDVDDTWDKVRKLDSRCNQLEKNLREQLRQANTTIQGLTTFRKNIEKQKHLSDVDQMFRDIEQLESTVNEYKRKNDSAMLDLAQTVSEISSFMEELKKYKHLVDVDIIWNDVEDLKEKAQDLDSRYSGEITALQNEMNERKQEENILSNRLLAVEGANEKLSQYEHLSDIDGMWEDVQLARTDIDANRTRFISIEQELCDLQQSVVNIAEYIDSLKEISHIEEIDEEWAHSQELDNRLKSSEKMIIEMQKDHLTTVEELKRKLLMAYWLSGGTFALLVLFILLSVMGIL